MFFERILYLCYTAGVKRIFFLILAIFVWACILVIVSLNYQIGIPVGGWAFLVACVSFLALIITGLLWIDPSGELLGYMLIGFAISLFLRELSEDRKKKDNC